jgi:hypothetical protein
LSEEKFCSLKLIPYSTQQIWFDIFFFIQFASFDIFILAEKKRRRFERIC